MPYVAFTAPHDPRQPPAADRQAYYDRLPPLPPNFLPQFPFDNGAMKGGRDENLGAWPRTEAMVRDQIAEYLQLFDLQADSFEMHNLADRQDHAAEVSRLRALMHNWQVRVGDPVVIPATSTTPPGIDLTGMARETDQWQPEWIVKKYFQQ